MTQNFSYKVMKPNSGRAHSVGQHHDGITGTNAQFVNDDFIYNYYKSRNEWQLAADRVMAEHFGVSLAGFRCDLAQNASICLISEQFTGNDLKNQFTNDEI